MRGGDYTVSFTADDVSSEYYNNRPAWDSADLVSVTLGSETAGIDASLSPADCSVPSLNLHTTNTYWASYSDYQTRQLSVDYSINNAGNDSVYNRIVGLMASNGVTSSSPMPVAVGNLSVSGSSGAIAIKYSVPTGIENFKASVYASAQDGCGNSYRIPGPYPGS